MRLSKKPVMVYKFIKSDMTSANGSAGVWEVGVWKQHKGDLELCRSGFHACVSARDALDYALGPNLCIMEVKGKHKDGGDKQVYREMRLLEVLPTKVIAVRFALACAERVLDKFENKYPNDDRPRKAIEAAKAWVAEPTKEREDAAAAAADADADAAYAAAAAYSAAAAAAAYAAEVEWQKQTLERIIQECRGK